MSQPNLLELEAPIKICGTLFSGLQTCCLIVHTIESKEILCDMIKLNIHYYI